MTDFVAFILSYLRRALYLAVPAVALCGIGLGSAAFILKKKGRAFPWKQAVLWLALVGYLVVVAVVTLIRPGGGGMHNINLHLFRAWKEAWNTFSQKDWLNILLNIAMFLPLGFLLPLLGRGMERWTHTLGAGFAVSLVIETIQFFSRRGLADVDDLLSNTLGCLAGYALVMLVLSLRRRQRGASVPYILTLAALAGAIALPFLAYEVQELGNLPRTPAYQVSTAGTRWTLACELSSGEDTLPIYQIPVPTKAECEEIGRQVLQAMGAEDSVDVWYYNEEVYLRSGNRCVSVYYLDGSYDYWEFRDEGGKSSKCNKNQAKKTSCGVFQPRHFLGRLLMRSSTSCTVSSETVLKSKPF